jgi:hypothetical protein
VLNTPTKTRNELEHCTVTALLACDLGSFARLLLLQVLALQLEASVRLARFYISIDEKTKASETLMNTVDMGSSLSMQLKVCVCAPSIVGALWCCTPVRLDVLHVDVSTMYVCVWMCVRASHTWNDDRAVLSVQTCTCMCVVYTYMCVCV